MVTSPSSGAETYCSLVPSSLSLTPKLILFWGKFSARSTELNPLLCQGLIGLLPPIWVEVFERMINLVFN